MKQRKYLESILDKTYENISNSDVNGICEEIISFLSLNNSQGEGMLEMRDKIVACLCSDKLEH